MNEDYVPPPITEEQWIRILGDHKVRRLVNNEQQAWAGKRAVRCMNCAHAGDAGGDPWRAWCMQHRFMTSNTFPVLCREYVSDKVEPSAAPQAPAVTGNAQDRQLTEQPAAPALHVIRDASLIAYRRLEWTGRMSRQQRLVMDFLALNAQRDYTRQELADALQLGINVITGRVNELMKSPFELIEELDRRQCRITGETAHALRARAAMKEAA